MNTQFNVISTFSGCGGSSLGYKMAGGKVLLAVEWDNNAVETYRINFPDTLIYHGDIANLTSEECMKLANIKPGELDILDGSPPCQGFSTAGKRNYNDLRNQLFIEYARLLQELQPKVFVMENVSGMVKGKMKLLFAQVMRTLKDCGYNVSCKLMNAKYYNVPQSRQRVIFIGVRNDLGIAPSHPKPQTRPATAKEAIGHLENEYAERRVELEKVKPGECLYSFNSGSKRIYSNKPAPTISCKGGTGGGHPDIHYAQNRYLKIQELKVLASFPESFKLIGAERKQVSRIGNSVPPNFMKAIAEHIRDNILSR